VRALSWRGHLRTGGVADETRSNTPTLPSDMETVRRRTSHPQNMDADVSRKTVSSKSANGRTYPREAKRTIEGVTEMKCCSCGKRLWFDWQYQLIYDFSIGWDGDWNVQCNDCCDKAYRRYLESLLHPLIHVNCRSRLYSLGELLNE